MLKNKIIISLIGIYIFFLCVIPPIVTNAVNLVCKNLSYNSKYEIQLKSPQFKIFILPIGILKTEEIIIKTKDNLTNLSVKDFEVKFRLLPLLSKKIHINSLSINKINLNTNTILKPQLDKDFFKKIETLGFRIDSISIGEFSALLHQKDIKTPIVYKGKDFLFQRKNRYIKLQNNSTLDVAGNISKITSNLFLPKNNNLNKTIFDFQISNVNIAPLRIYFKHYLPKNLKELRGDLNLDATKEGVKINLINFAGIMNDPAKSIIFPDKISVESKFDITRNCINFENIDINSKNIQASINGKIFDYFGKTMPTLDINIRFNKSEVADIIKMAPPFNIEELNVYKLKKYNFSGDLFANFSIKGRLPEPEVLGDVYISNAILIKPIPNTTKGATIKLKFVGKHADFDVTVPAGGAEKIEVKGSQEIYNIKYADLTVKSTQSVDLKAAQNVLIPLHEILNFIIGPVPIMDINGKGNIDIVVKGNRKNPHIWGVFNARDCLVWFNDLPDFKLSNAEAKLKFVDQNATFKTITSQLNNEGILIRGVCDLNGKFDFDVFSENQPTNKLYQGLINSKFVPSLPKDISLPKVIGGKTDFIIKVFGTVKDVHEIELNKNTFVKGQVKLNDNSFVVENIEVNKVNADVNFASDNIDAQINAKVGNLPIDVVAKTKDKFLDLNLNVARLNPNLLISDTETRDRQYLPYISLIGSYKGDYDKIDYSKLNLKATILDSLPNSKAKYNTGGVVSIAHNKIYIKNIKGFIENKLNTFDLNLVINNAFSKSPEVNGDVKFKTPNLSLYNDIIQSEFFPTSNKKYIKNFKFEKGPLDLSAKIYNNKIFGNTELNDVSLVYLPLDLPIEILNGNLNIRNNSLKLNKVNLLADKMPVLADGEIKDIFKKPYFDLYFNSKPQQEFIDKYINKNQIYPIKIKGDIVYWAKVKGNIDNYDLAAEIDLSKNSSVYHFGATIGDIENAIEVSLDSKISNKNQHRIREFSYDKIIDSQSGKQTRLNLLKSWGSFKLIQDDLIFDNLHIKTSHPTDARIFNIIFRKPNIKQGQFTSSLKFNGKSSDPKIIGDFHIFETDIPFFDTTMKNIELVFKDKTIDIASKGEVMGNEVSFNGVLKNKLTQPYYLEKGILYTKDLDLNRIFNKLKISQVDDFSTFESFDDFKLSAISFKNLVFKADNIRLRNLQATNYEANTSLSDSGIFNVNRFVFDVAQGSLSGGYRYNLKTNDMSLNLDINKISADDIMLALFDLKNQIYGDMTGRVNLSCNGTNFERCMQTLNGNSIFNVKDGRMPKLGSLEYLLKAGNLVKGGLTGLSINSVVELISPLKTGEFSDISGFANIKNGVAEDLEIKTKGKDLSLFVSGKYNFATSEADMQVFGLLSRKMSSFLGPLGNISINTLFNVIPGVDLSKDSVILEKINKIPGVELSSKDFRRFVADIKGDINGEDYVTSFNWVN